MKLSLILISVLILSSCHPKLNNVTENNTNALKRVWMLVKLNDFPKDTLVKYETKMNLVSTDNTGNAYMGCNRIGFNYETFSRNSIMFSKVFSTKMYCEKTAKIESDFINQLEKCNFYHISSHKLSLITSTGDSIQFIAQDWD